ncbi:hypothetical protein [Mycobacterium paraintracellulare]|uniref:hypothetical protein n=1 Tax=Mycobacterium paraintracellulare TaxID=1138383 RepID=UPI000252A3D9|nr:hypothetical protein [Mycobacterium paraintracellulare]AFC54285.1 hypothetical protein OCQ_27730 [Mycobacterium paraintracellulare]
MTRRGWVLFAVLSGLAVGWVVLHADPAAFNSTVVGWPRVLFGRLGEWVAR